MSHPIPGTDPCNPEQPKGPIERSSPASNPCDGVNPYGYTTEEGCPATVDLATPPIVRGPQPDPTGPGVGPGPVRQTTLPLSGPAGWSPAGVAVG